MSDELKPCPWEKPGEHHDLEMVDVGALMWGRCATCMAAGPCEDSRDKAAAAWNTRAAATDGQFAVAVHNGEVWQRVRECRFALEEDREMLAEKAACGPGEFVTQDMPDLLWTCSACGEQYRNGLDSLPGWLKHCPNCGAKVVV